MPRQPYTTLLYSAHGVGSAAIDLDPAFAYVLRSVSLFIGDLSGGGLAIVDAASATIYQVELGPALSGQWNYDDVRIALRSGDTLSLNGSNSPDVYLTAYRFLLPT